MVTRMFAQDAITRNARTSGVSSARSGAMINRSEPAGATNAIRGVRMFLTTPSTATCAPGPIGATARDMNFGTADLRYSDAVPEQRSPRLGQAPADNLEERHLDIIRLGDGLSIVGGATMMFLAYAAIVLGTGDRWPIYDAAALLGLLIGGKFLRLQNLNLQLRRVGLAWSVAVGLLSRGWILLWWGPAMTGIFLIKIASHHFLSNWAQSGRQVSLP